MLELKRCSLVIIWSSSWNILWRKYLNLGIWLIWNLWMINSLLFLPLDLLSIIEIAFLVYVFITPNWFLSFKHHILVLNDLLFIVNSDLEKFNLDLRLIIHDQITTEWVSLFTLFGWYSLFSAFKKENVSSGLFIFFTMHKYMFNRGI